MTSLSNHTIAQLQREIAYFEQQRAKTRCPDRQRRATAAITRRRKEWQARGGVLSPFNPAPKDT